MVKNGGRNGKAADGLESWSSVHRGAAGEMEAMEALQAEGKSAFI